MAKIAGSLWVEGDDMHYVDTNSVEWLSLGDLFGASPAGALPGSIWIEANQLHYINEAGTKELVLTPKPVASTVPPVNALSGSIWLESSLINWIHQPNRRNAHWDVAPVIGHNDIAHVDIGAHSDTPHTDVHTDTHGDVPHSDNAHTDASQHGDVPHSDSHNDSHADWFWDWHDDVPEHVTFTDHVDCNRQYSNPFLQVHFDCWSTPGGREHTDQYHGDSGGDHTGWPAHYDHLIYEYDPHLDAHDDQPHQDSHGDIPHSDVGHADWGNHDDIPHGDSHTDTHGDVPHQDVAHVDSSNHSDTPHTDIHTDDPHIDSPILIGP